MNDQENINNTVIGMIYKGIITTKAVCSLEKTVICKNLCVIYKTHYSIYEKQHIFNIHPTILSISYFVKKLYIKKQQNVRIIIVNSKVLLMQLSRIVYVFRPL